MLYYLCILALAFLAESQSCDWSSASFSASNDRHSTCTQLNPGLAPKFKRACAAKFRVTGGSRTSNVNPLLVGNMMFYAGQGDRVGAAYIPSGASSTDDFDVCADAWSYSPEDLLQYNIPGVRATVRATPGYYIRENGKGTVLFVGHPNFFSPNVVGVQFAPAKMIAVDAETGDILWRLTLTIPGQAENAFLSLFTAPSIHNNVAYVGLSSGQSFYTGNDGSFLIQFIGFDPFKASFRGRMLAIDLSVPAVKWTRYSLPAKPATATGDWFYGNGVWGSSPSYIAGAGKDNAGLVFYGVGNLYSYPQHVADCMSTPESVSTSSWSTTLRGQTGAGAKVCYDDAASWMQTSFGINPQTDPVAVDSMVALNAADGSFAWHVPFHGIDAWSAQCGSSGNCPAGHPIAVGGPDWDVGGSAPVIADIDGQKVAIGHTKGGDIRIVDALTGAHIRSIDTCLGGSTGGVHFGLAYDPENEQIIAPCSGGLATDAGPTGVPELLADGSTICATGHINAIDIRTGDLNWQAIPARNERDTATCLARPKNIDEDRRKYGITYDNVHRETVIPGVTVNEMPDSMKIPISLPGAARIHGVPITTNKNIVVFTAFHGTVYAVKASNGQFVEQYHCAEGAIYGGASVSGDVLAFACGYEVFGGDFAAGDTIVTYKLVDDE